MKSSTKTKAQIIVLGTVFVILGIAGYMLYPKDSDQPEYIFDNSHHISLADVEEALTPLPDPAQKTDTVQPVATGKQNPEGQTKMENQDIDYQNLFPDGKLINSRTTLKYFKFLEALFKKSPNIDDHFDKVRAYLFAHFSPEDAQVLFDTYQKYLKCEIGLSKEFRNLSVMTSPEEAIALLERIQESRRAHLGEALADTIFGADVKTKEYALRRAAIVNNNDLNGQEKESMISQLNSDMWGDDAQAVEDRPEPYNRYQEKLEIYHKDLSEMDQADQQTKIKEFREQFFPPEVVEKFNDIDRRMTTETHAETQYYEQEKAITGNTALTDEEKKQQIKNLQDETFGEEADAFRRREAIDKGRETFIREVEAKKKQAENGNE